MLQMVIITTDKLTRHLQDEINKWLAKADSLKIKIHNIYITSGMATIFYYIEDEEEIKRIKGELNVK